MLPTSTAPRSRRRQLPRLLLVVLIAAVLLGGCARVRTALAVQPDDTVAGQIVVATPQTSPEDPGPVVTLPPELVSEVDVVAYRQEGYTGSVLRFSGLGFDQVPALTRAVQPAGEAVQFTLRRVGGRLLVDGTVNLKTVSVDKADFQLKISFPGQVLDHNGDLDGNTVSWTFIPSEVGDITAVVAYDDPDAPSVLNWTLGLSAVVALVALAVVGLARRARNPAVSPPIR